VAGSQVPPNQPVIVNATANDPNGITHAELWVGGNVVDQQQSAIAEGQPTFPATLRWTPSAGGSYTLEVRAFNSLGISSAPTTVMITVAGQGVADTPTPMPSSDTPTPSGPPLAVTTTDLNVRGGPGQDYPILGLLRVNTQVEVTGKNQDGSWWQVAYPADDADRGWIFAAFTRTSNTENVTVVETPVPPTPIPTPTGTPTATPSPTASPTRIPTLTTTPSRTPVAPIVEFRATETTINPGGCTNLEWHIENVRAAFLNGGEFNNYGVTGPFGSVGTCPTSTTTYVLRAETDDGTIERSVTVNVRGEQTETLNHVGGGTVSDDEAVFTPQTFVGDNDTNQALRAFFAFDISSLSDKQISDVQLDLSNYGLTGDPFGQLQTLRVEEVDWGSSLEAADYDTPAAASLATMSGSAGLGNSINVTSRVVRRLSGGSNSYRIRLRFEVPTNGNNSEDSVDWAGRTVRLVVRYYR
jgi:uncharacterized protein YraI